MKKLNNEQMINLSGKMGAHGKILGCSIVAAVAAGSILFSAGMLSVVGVLVLTQAGCIAIEFS